MFLFNYDINYLARHYYNFYNLLAFQPLGSGGIAECQTLDIGAFGTGSHSNGKACLAVEGYGIRLCIGFEIAFLGLRPLGIADGGSVAKRMPQFFGNMRRKWCKQHQKRLQYLSAAAAMRGKFVYTYHKGGHRGVEREIVNVGRNLGYKTMETAQVFFGSGAVIRQKFFSFVEESPQFFRNLFTPSIPLVSHGLDCSKGPRNIS